LWCVGWYNNGIVAISSCFLVVWVPCLDLWSLGTVVFHFLLLMICSACSTHFKYNACQVYWEKCMMFLHSHSHRELWVKDVDSPVCFLHIVHLSVDCAAQSWHHSLSTCLAWLDPLRRDEKVGQAVMTPQH
jgi:hypothetical protein